MNAVLCKWETLGVSQCLAQIWMHERIRRRQIGYAVGGNGIYDQFVRSLNNH